MLSRYTIYRRRPAGAAPQPKGKDTRHRTNHILRPTQEIVEKYLADPTDAAWRKFKRAYVASLKERFRNDREKFDELAKFATDDDLYIGCSCPTKKNPIDGRCHTYLALEFMKKKYSNLDVVIPATSQEDEVMREKSNMYADAKTWNPFKGCRFDCTYCTPSFKKQSKRNQCPRCRAYTPHCHEDRLSKIPSAPIVFVAGNADIAFCPPDFTQRIIERIKNHNRISRPKTFYFQSKRPSYFKAFLAEFPDNVILLTTLETNRDTGYRGISKAPPPSVRYEQFKELDYSRKVVTIEPVLDFDLRTFVAWLRRLRPEYVWLGYNSKPTSKVFHDAPLPEPSTEKLRKFTEQLVKAEIEVRGKDLRDLELPTTT